MRISFWYLRSRHIIALVVFFSFACLFVRLRSQNYLAVDGAVRCFGVYHQRNLFFHGNNHLLYPLNILAWYDLLTALGLESDGPVKFISLMQVMNCVAGAGCLAILCFLMHIVTSSWRLALALATGYGLSRAFLLHATNSAEPMLGVFWSLLALLLAASSFRIKPIWPIALSGVLFSLAMATYQSTVVLAPAAMALIWQSRPQESPRASLCSQRYWGLGVFAVSGFTATVCIYGIAYWLSGVTSFPTMLRRFFTLEAAGVYGGISISKLINTLIGLVGNIFPVLPPNYAGIRALWRGGQRLWVVWLLLVVVLFFGLLVVCTFHVSRNWRGLPRRMRIAMSSAAVGFVTTLIPLMFWDPIYDKLWLQPLACLGFLVVSSLDIAFSDQRISILFSRIGPILLLAGVISNLTWAVPSHLQETPYLKEAQQLVGILGKEDLVVSDYDGVSVLYGSIWADNGQVFSFPTEAALHGIAVVSRLHEAIVKTHRRGGRVYFLGVLDQTEETWKAFLWFRCGVPYSEMDLYRAHSRVRAEFKQVGSIIRLREFDQPPSTSASQ